MRADGQNTAFKAIGVFRQGIIRYRRIKAHITVVFTIDIKAWHTVSDDNGGGSGFRINGDAVCVFATAAMRSVFCLREAEWVAGVLRPIKNIGASGIEGQRCLALSVQCIGAASNSDGEARRAGARESNRRLVIAAVAIINYGQRIAVIDVAGIGVGN